MPGGRFYVYELSKEDEIIYVGKGSGCRFKSQMKRFRSDGRIVRTFASEKAAYEFEVTHISRVNPKMNLYRGGNGRRAARICTRKTKWEKEVEAIGTHAYAARLWLKHCPLNMRTASITDKIRQVAYG